MANITQVEVNGTTYDICDATARDSLFPKIIIPNDIYPPLSNTQAVLWVQNNSGNVHFTTEFYKGKQSQYDFEGDGKIYVRTRTDTTDSWSSWMKIVEPLGPGMTHTQRFVVSGYITNNAKSYVGTIPFGRIINGTITLTEFPCVVRQNGNYLIGSGASGGGINIPSSKFEYFTVNNRNIDFRFTLDTAPANALNNDVASIDCTPTMVIS